MAWRTELIGAAGKELGALDKQIGRRVVRLLRERSGEPRRQATALVGSQLWRWRVGDYRIVAEIRDAEELILVVRIAHRRDVYRDR